MSYHLLEVVASWDSRPNITTLFLHNIRVCRFRFPDVTLCKLLVKVGDHELLEIIETLRNKFPTLTLRNYKYPPPCYMIAASIFLETHMALLHIPSNLKCRASPKSLITISISTLQGWR